MLALAPQFLLNTPQRGDLLHLLQSLADDSVTVGHFDPQHRSVLDAMAYGNEGERQIERCLLPQMSDAFIDLCTEEFARVLKPSGYFFMWSDTYRLGEGKHLPFKKVLPCVDIISWDDENPKGGNGYRSRRCGGYLLVLQKPPKRPRATWTDHKIRDKWSEAIDRRFHPHVKPRGLLTRLVGATTKVGDLVVDPAAGSFVLLDICRELGRDFIGCDIAYREPNGEGSR